MLAVAAVAILLLARQWPGADPRAAVPEPTPTVATSTVDHSSGPSVRTSASRSPLSSAVTRVLAFESRPPGGMGVIAITSTCVLFDQHGGLVLGVLIENVSRGPMLLTSVHPEQPLMLMQVIATSPGGCSNGPAPWKVIRLGSGQSSWVSTRVSLTGQSCLVGVTYALQVDLQVPTSKRLRFQPFGNGIGGDAFAVKCGG